MSVGYAAGEVLGCTAPVVGGSADAIVFVADGRFHLEAIMIANPDIPAFRYSPGLSCCGHVSFNFCRQGGGMWVGTEASREGGSLSVQRRGQGKKAGVCGLG